MRHSDTSRGSSTATTPTLTSDSGTEESVTAPDAGRSLDARRPGHRARTGNMSGAAGDISPEELGALLDRFWQPPRHWCRNSGKGGCRRGRGSFEIVPFDVPQSVELFSHEGIAANDPDFFAPSFSNEVRRLPAASRGFFRRRLREKRGLDLTEIGDLSRRLQPCRHACSDRSPPRNEVVAEAIEVVKNEWAPGRGGRESPKEELASD